MPRSSRQGEQITGNTATVFVKVPVNGTGPPVTSIRNRRVACALRLHHYAGWIGQYYCRNVKVRTTLAKISGRYATTSLSRLSGADILKPF